jgi:hypothetical protein
MRKIISHEENIKTQTYVFSLRVTIYNKNIHDWLESIENKSKFTRLLYEKEYNREVREGRKTGDS